MFMLRDEKSTVKTVDDLMDINRKIVSLGEQFNKPVCATCDVHFMDPDDAIYRKILMAGMGFKDADEQAPCSCGQRKRCSQSLSIWEVTSVMRSLSRIRE